MLSTQHINEIFNTTYTDDEKIQDNILKDLWTTSGITFVQAIIMSYKHYGAIEYTDVKSVEYDMKNENEVLLYTLNDRTKYKYLDLINISTDQSTLLLYNFISINYTSGSNNVIYLYIVLVIMIQHLIRNNI